MILERFPLHHPGLHEDQTRLSNLRRRLWRTQRCSSSVPGLSPSDSYHTCPASRQASRGLQTPTVSAELIAGSGGRRDAQGPQGPPLEAHRLRELLERTHPHPVCNPLSHGCWRRPASGASARAGEDGRSRLRTLGLPPGSHGVCSPLPRRQGELGSPHLGWSAHLSPTAIYFVLQIQLPSPLKPLLVPHSEGHRSFLGVL